MHKLHTFRHIKCFRNEFKLAEEYVSSSKEIIVQTTNDKTLFSGKKILVIFEPGAVSITTNSFAIGTYYRTHKNENREIIEKIIFDNPPFNENLPVETSLYYYTTYTVTSDSEALTETDAMLRLISSPSKYGESTDINLPFDYELEGKSGLIDPENLYKLTRSHLETKFTNIQFSTNTMKPVALIRIDEEDYNIEPYSVSATISGELTARFTLYFDKNSNDGSFIQVNSFWCNNESLTMSVAANTELRDTIKYLRIQISFSQQKVAKIGISVQKIDKLENAKLGENVSQTNKQDLLFNGLTNAEIFDQILGYSHSSRYSLPLSSEVIYLPKQIISGDLNDYKISGHYWGAEDNENPKSVLNRPSIGSNVISDSFRLYVESTPNGNVYQRFVSVSKTYQCAYSIRNQETGLIEESSNPAPYIFERVFRAETIDGDKTWSEWNEVGRRYHTHNLEDLIESPFSLHFTEEMLNKLNEISGSVTDTPWKSLRLSGPPTSTTQYKNGDVVSSSTGGIWQVVGSKFVRIDIAGLYVFDTDDSGTDQNQTGLITRKLYQQIFSNTFMKQLNENNSFVLVSNDTNFYNNTVQNMFDFVARTSNTQNANNSISFGFGNTIASAENSFAFGMDVLQYNAGASFGVDIDSFGIGGFGIGLNVLNNQLVLGKFNKQIPDAGIIFGFGSSNDQRANAGFISQDGYANFRGVKYYAESDQNQNVASAPQDYLFKANGQFQDLKEFATQDQITELQNTKVDKGSSTSIIFEALDGTKYPLVLILDPEIVQVISPNGNNVIVAYRAGYIEFMEEMLRINTLGDENHEEPYITIGKEVSTSGNTEYVESVFDETSETYNELDFSSSISSGKMSGIGITNYPVKVNFNTFVVTYKNGETLDLSQYFLSDEE